MTSDEERLAAWASVPWETSVFNVLPFDLARRLYLSGWQTVGQLDRTIRDYAETTLKERAVLKPSEYQQVIRSLFLWCRKQFHTQLVLVKEVSMLKGNAESPFAEQVRWEVQQARALHAPINSLHEGFAVMLEELEEFWDEVKKRRENRNPLEMAKELIQIGAMAQRCAEDCQLPIEEYRPSHREPIPA